MSSPPHEAGTEAAELKRLRLIAEIAMVVSQPGAMESIFTRALGPIMEFSDSQLGHYYFVEREHQTPTAVPSSLWHIRGDGDYRSFIRESENISFPQGSGLPGRVVADHQPQWVEDISLAEDYRRREVALAAGLQSAFAVPVVAGDRLVAVLECYAKEKRGVDEDLVSVLGPLGILLGRVLERHEAERMRIRIAKIVDISRHGIVGMNETGHVEMWNPGAEAMFGWTAEEALGRLVSDLMIPEDMREAHRKGMNRYLTTGEAKVLDSPVELPAVNRAGESFPVEITISTLKSGDKHEFYAFIQNISARKEAERQLRQRERDLAKAQDIARLGTWTWEVAEDRITWTDTLYKIFGLTRDAFEASYESYLHALHPDDREAMDQVVQEAFHTGEPFMTTHRVIRPNGDVRHVLAHGEVRRDEQGNVTSMAGTAQDITDQVEIQLKETELLQERARSEALAQSNEDLQEFAYAASHDLQEPLRTITGYLQLIERRYADKLGEDGHDFIEFAVEASRRMQELIEGLLVLARVTTKAKPFSRVALETVISEACDNLDMAIQESSAEITWDPLPTVRGDRLQLLQLFQNLLGNALKFRGDKPARIHLSVSNSGGNHIIAVKDHGVGFDPKFARRIFVVFQRLHARGKYPGTGLGLALCRRIVDRHHGRIWAEAIPGEGATFYVELPETTVGEPAGESSDQTGHP